MGACCAPVTARLCCCCKGDTKPTVGKTRSQAKRLEEHIATQMRCPGASVRSLDGNIIAKPQALKGASGTSLDGRNVQEKKGTSGMSLDGNNAQKITTSTSWPALAFRAVLLSCFVLCVNEYVASISMDDRCWLLLCSILFTMWLSSFSPVTHAGTPSAECVVAEEPEISSGDQRKAFSTFMRGLQNKIDAFEKERASPCDAPGQERDSPWHDCSRKVAKVFLCFLKMPARLLVSMEFQIKDQVEGIPLISLSFGKICGGVIPIFTAPRHYPLWLPFCSTAQCLTRLGPCKEVWLLKFKIAFITADVILGLSVEDRLDTDGCIDLLMASPDEGMEGQSWFGIKIPPLTAGIRVPITAFRMSLFPHDHDDGLVKVKTVMIDSLGIPWIHKLFWKALSVQVLPTVLKMDKKFADSAMDRDLNSPDLHAVQARSFF